MTASKIVAAAASGAGGGAALDIDDVFSCHLYEGTGSAQVIENGISLGNSNDGGSVEFDGTGDYLNLSTPVVPASGQFSLEAFIYPTATSDEAIASQHSNGTTGRFIFRLDNGKLNFNWAASELTDANSITANAWSHCLVTRDASNVIRLFVNGALRKSTTNSVTFDQTNFTIGASRIASPEKHFNGFISNVRVVSGAIPTEYQTSSTTEGAAIYTTPTTGLTAVSNTALLTCQGSTPLVDNSSNSYAITSNADAAARAFGPFTGSSGEGGMVWLKSRSNAFRHFLFDTERGVTKNIYANETYAENTVSNGLTAFNSNGFTLGDNYDLNGSGADFVSWTFRKSPMFDVQTWTGNGATTQISHSLGSTPGFWVFKRTDTTGPWYAGHYDGTTTRYLQLNTSSDQSTSPHLAWGDFPNNSTVIPPTSTYVTFSGYLNVSGASFVGYFWASHNSDGGFGPDGDQDIIKCGSYTGNTSGDLEINVGFEPQWVLIKNASASRNWQIVDIMRGFGNEATSSFLAPSSSAAENANLANIAHLTSTGFKLDQASGQDFNENSNTFIYMAIRRGPLAAPDDATKVFNVNTYSNNGNSNIYNTGFDVDMSLSTNRDGANNFTMTRLTGNDHLKTDTNAAAVTESSGSVKWWDSRSNYLDLQTNWWGTNNAVSWAWKRAPSYFDVVAYTGTGSARTVSHNLSAVPEMMWVKDRGRNQNWAVYHKGNTSEPETDRLRLNEADATVDDNAYWNDTAPTSSVFTVGTDGDVNASGENYIAYLFATVAGVSKVGSYTGNGGTQNIDCGFSSGARFVLIKRTDTSEGWKVHDSVRGIVAGDDPFVELNNNNAENSSFDLVDPYSGGFAVNNFAGWNASSGSYIFYAIA